MPPQRVGPYEIVEKLGEGGMGVVYKANDTRLGRSVALKFVKAQFTRQWEREARAVAALNHPHIATLYDVGEHEGSPYLAMEFVKGAPLKGPLALQTVAEYGIQVADALAAAHAAGIVHRDLKPANILVTQKGSVKVLDFGLAKLTEQSQDGATPTNQTTAMAGTPGYMAPEQLQGKSADARSDIFAFGCLLYELIAGRRAFPGDTMAAVLASTAMAEPKPLENVPEELDKLVRRCLRKDPERRLQYIADARVALEDIRDESGPRRAASSAPVGGSRAKPGRPGRWVAAALAGLACAVAGAALAGLLVSASRPEKAERFTPFATESEGETMPAWSPDGKSLAYLVEIDGVAQVFTRSLDSPVRVQVTKASAGCGAPFWSRDGSRIFYQSGRNVWSSGVAGGEPRLELADAVQPAISPDGKTFVFFRGGMGARSLWTATRDGKAQPYAQEPFPATFVAGYQPTFLADGSRIGVLVDRSSGGGAGEFWVLPWPSGKPRRVPAPLPASAWLHFAWWPGGRYVLLGSEDPAYHHLRTMDTKTGSMRWFTTGTGLESAPAISPEGSRIAFVSGTADRDLIEIPLDGSSIRPLLATSSREESGEWLPSGKQYAYITDVRGAQEVWLRSTSENWARPILAAGAEAPPPWYYLADLRVSPDGQRIACDVLGARHGIWILSLAGGHAVPLETESTDQHCASWSPDGNRVAYRRLHDGKWELAVVSLGGGKPASLAENGSEAGAGGYDSGGVTDWSSTGEWISYQSSKGLELVAPDFRRTRLLSPSRYRYFAFSRDGATLFALRRSESRKWQLAVFDVASGMERPPRDLPIPAGSGLSNITVHPDGKRLLVTLSTPRQDIWIMENFAQPGSRLWF